ncbi:MAG: hypothetical protein AAF502_17220 [Bacteroidota bacterium]
MLDIISNAMAGIAVLFFLHVALQLQTPPPTPVRGRAVFEIELKVTPGAYEPSVFLLYKNEKRPVDDYLAYGGGYDGDLEIDKAETSFEFTEDTASMIGFERLLVRDTDNPLKWTVHLMDPLEGTYSIGMIYVDHEKFYREPTPAKIKLESYFEFSEGDEVYQSKEVTRDVMSPTVYHRFEVEITETGLQLQ